LNATEARAEPTRFIIAIRFFSFVYFFNFCMSKPNTLGAKLLEHFHADKVWRLVARVQQDCLIRRYAKHARWTIAKREEDRATIAKGLRQNCESPSQLALPSVPSNNIPKLKPKVAELINHTACLAESTCASFTAPPLLWGALP
jgi:hypothetical protein